MTQNTADSLRVLLKQARQTMSVADRQRASLLLRARLYTWLATHQTQQRQAAAALPQIVAGFWPLADEPDLLELYRQWHEQGLTVVLPVMQSDHSLHFHPWTPQMPMQARQFGVMEPAEGEDTLPDILLVPLLGFTIDGHRIGYGKGFYDRTLARLRMQGLHPTAIGVAWDCANINAIASNYQPAAHDQALDAVITPETWYPHEPAFGAIPRLS